MAAPCGKFDRVNGFIKEVCQNVEDSRKLCELICLDSHKLLQPWPPEILTKDTGQNKDGHDGQSNIHSRKEVIESGRGSDSGNITEDEVTLSAEEARALAEVEDILIKAQQARRLQAKLTKSKTTKARTYISPQTPFKQNKHQISNKVDEAGNTQHNESSNQVQTSSSESVDTDLNREVAVISQSKLKSLLGQTTNPSKSTGCDQNSVKIKNKSVVSTTKRPASRSSGVVKVPRPTSAAKMQYRTTSSEIGKHSSKTRKPPSGASSRYLQRNQEKQEQRAAQVQRSKPPVNRSLSTEGLSGTCVKKQTLVRSQSEERSSKVKTSGRETKSADSKRPQSVQSRNSSQSSDQLSGVGDLEERIEGMSLSMDLSRQQEQQEAVTVESANQFLLKKDGSSLKVPVKLKKLHSNTEKLREKLAATSNNLDGCTNTAGGHFRMRLEAKISPDTPPQSIRDVAVKLEQLHVECSQLCYVARELQQLAASITGTCTWQEIYRTKALLHTITTRYNKLQEEIHCLRQVETNLLSNSKHRSLPESPGEEQTRPLPVSTSTWFPSSKKAYRNGSPLSDGTEGASSGCSSGLQPSSGCSSVLQYRRVKDLQRLTALQYQAQFVMWQMDLEKLIAEDILPILQEMDPADEEFIPLYRTIYGLVCHSGEAYPSVVRDSIGDSDEENGDGDHDNG